VAGVEDSAQLYAFGTVATKVNVVHADRSTPGFMRSPPVVPYIYALESAMDEMAIKLDIDPVEFRRINDTAVSPIGNNVERARYVNDNLADYIIPVNADVQDVEVILVPEIDAEVNPAGIKGLGELGNVGTAAAIANAVYHATGQRVRQLPIRIEKILGS
jgi:CO/xanthine dehydrogenase Mo-binding subunit